MSVFRRAKTLEPVLRRLEEDGGFSSGFIYVIEQRPYAKIGFSFNPDSRLAALQTSTPQKLRLLCVAPGSMRLERAMHRILGDAGLSVRGEWYLLEDILHVFPILERITMSAIASAKGEVPTVAEPVNAEAYYFQFQWCCHEHYASSESLFGHLAADHQLSYARASEMTMRFAEDPTQIGVKCRGEEKDD